MAYTPQAWSDLPATTTPVDATRLNYLEAGLQAAAAIADSALAAGGASTRQAKTANYTAVIGDLVAADTTGGTFTVTIPAASGGKGRVLVKWVAGAVAPTIALSGSDHLNTATGSTTATPVLLSQGYQFESDGTSIWTVTADDVPLGQLLAASSTWTGNNKFTTLGVGIGFGTPATPFDQDSVLDGSTMRASTPAIGADIAGAGFAYTFKGGFTSLAPTASVTISLGSPTIATGSIPAGVAARWTVSIPGAGPAGATMKTTIASVVAGTSVTLNVAASTAVTGATATFSAIPDWTRIWGFDSYAVTGTTAGDLAGISNFVGGEVEAHLCTPSASLTTLFGLQVDCDLLSTATGATVSDMRGLVVAAPNSSVPSGATVSQYVGLWVDDPTTHGFSAGSSFSILANGIVRFMGSRIDTNGNLSNNGSGDMNIYAGFGESDGARLQLMRTANGGHARARLDTSGAGLRVWDGSADKHSLDRTGNAAIGTGTGSYGGGLGGVVFIANAGTPPSTNPTGGGVLYVTGGALTYRGSSGTVTTLGPA